MPAMRDGEGGQGIGHCVSLVSEYFLEMFRCAQHDIVSMIPCKLIVMLNEAPLPRRSSLIFDEMFRFAQHDNDWYGNTLSCCPFPARFSGHCRIARRL